MSPETRSALIELGHAAAKALEDLSRADHDKLYGRLARALAGCSFLPGSWDKRFAHDMARIAGTVDGYSDKQREQLLRLADKYRRQLKPAETMLAEDLAYFAAGRREPPQMTIAR